MNDLIVDVLKADFKGVEQTQDVKDFYIEVSADLHESAEARLKETSSLTPAEAVRQAHDEMGDLKSLVKVIANNDAEMVQEIELEEQRKVSEQISITGINKIDLEAGTSNIKLVQSKSADIEISYTQRGFFQGKLNIVNHDGTLNIKVPLPKSWAYAIPFAHPRQLIQVGLPSAFEGTLAVESATGNLRATHIDAPNMYFDFKNKSGNMRLVNLVIAQLSVRLKSGNLRIDNVVAEDWQLNLKSGNLNVSDSTGKFDVVLKSGNAKFTDITGLGTFEGKSGNLTVDWRKVTGDIILAIKSGNIKSALPNNETAFAFEAQSGNGTVKVDYTATFDVKTMSYIIGQVGDEPKFTISGKSQSGNVRFR